MFKKAVILCILFACQVQAIDHTKLEGIDALNAAITKLNLSVDDTIFIFDCDGVLTDCATPVDGQTRSRGDSVKMLRNLVAAGYQIIVSSAWDKFHETEARIRQLGVETELQLQEGEFERDYVAEVDANRNIVNPMLESEYAKKKCRIHGPGPHPFAFTAPVCSCEKREACKQKRLNEKGIQYMKNGRLISVAASHAGQPRSASNKPNFLQKAVSPLIEFPGRKFKHVVFVDDSLDNINIFKSDIANLPYAEDAKIHIFELERIQGAVRDSDTIRQHLDTGKCGLGSDTENCSGDEAQQEQVLKSSQNELTAAFKKSGIGCGDDDDDEWNDDK